MKDKQDLKFEIQNHKAIIISLKYRLEDGLGVETQGDPTTVVMNKEGSRNK